MIFRRSVAWTLVVAGVLFAFCWAARPFGSYEPRLTRGDPVCDYRVFIKKCIVEPCPYHPVDMQARDACYPPIAYSLVKCFPLTQGGETAYKLFLYAGLFVGMSFFLLQRQRKNMLLCIGALAITVPFVSGAARGNPVSWAVGALCVYLAWFDSEVLWKRLVAAFALALSAALKLTPAVYGLLYLRGRVFNPGKWPKEEILVAVVSFMLLLLVPFMWFGGPNEVLTMIQNAFANSSHYSQTSDFGLVPLAHLLNRYLPVNTLGVASQLTMLLSFVLCLASVFARRLTHSLILLGVAMSFACHFDYALAYLMPAFACWLGESRPSEENGRDGNVILLTECALWFLILTPLPYVYSYRFLEIYLRICDVAVMALGFLTFVKVVAARRLRSDAQGVF